MSDIPFVNLLGDELERAAKRAQPRPNRTRRRLGLLAAAAALLASGTALAGGLLSGDVEHQATSAIACYDGADPDFSHSVAVVPLEVGSAYVSPVDICRRELGGRQSAPLVACGAGDGVAVIPRSRPSPCLAAGFAPLDAAYAAARERAAALERRILAIETSADCIPPGELARRVQRLLDRTGWSDWTVQVGRGPGSGPCGSISAIGGDGRRYLAGMLDPGAQRFNVGRSAPRRITDLLYSAERSLLAPLFAESGARCFTFGSLSERVREVFAAERVQVSFRAAAIPRGSELDDSDGRWTRYQAGCAILTGAEPGATPDSAVIELAVKP